MYRFYTYYKYIIIICIYLFWLKLQKWFSREQWEMFCAMINMKRILERFPFKSEVWINIGRFPFKSEVRQYRNASPLRPKSGSNIGTLPFKTEVRINIGTFPL